MANETRWTLDGEPVEVEDVLMDPCVEDWQRDQAMSLEPGESIVLGGGAGAEFTLRREA
jgi:hypothetical protein